MLRLLSLAVMALSCTRAPPAASKLTVPEGFSVSVFAVAPNARAMTWGDDGTLFVGSRAKGTVYAIRDRNHDQLGEVQIVAQGLDQPSGVAFKDGALFVAEVERISRYDGIVSALDGTIPKPAVVAQLPSERHHGWREIAFGPDGKLYVAIGAPCNVCRPEAEFASIVRMNADGTGRETVASGVRNTLGLAWHPTTKRLYFTDNGRDWLGDELPNDELNVVEHDGAHFGFPSCHQGDVLDDEFADGRTCADFVAPLATLGPHTAALGLTFYTGTSFPEAYRENLFIALHGSWNRSKKSGYEVLRVRLVPGRAPTVERFLTGFLDGDRVIGRPADVTVAPDGALLVSDDEAGAIYRITPTR